jgi:hypothetical protein
LGLDGHQELDPYEAHLVNDKLRIHKAPLSARPVGILTNLARGRNLRLINPASRVIRANDVHELSCTLEDPALGEIVNDVAYLAFAVFDKSGVIARGDIVEVDGIVFGTVLGYNEVHMPNHINIVVHRQSLTTGFAAGWGLDTSLLFRRPIEEEIGRNSGKRTNGKRRRTRHE